MKSRTLITLLALWLATGFVLASAGCGGEKSLPPKADKQGGGGDSESEDGDPKGRIQDADPNTEAGDSSPNEEGDPFLLEEEVGPRFKSAAACGRCHTAIYEEWKASYHGQAMSDPLFNEFSAEPGVNREECIRCHAPVPLRIAGFETPIARADRREDAVSCLTCHQAGNRVTGPSKGLSGPCNPVHDPDQTNPVKMCFPCHNQHDTGNEWLAGPWSPTAPEPRTHPQENCISCHMEEVVRPIVNGGTPRKSRRHTWFGGHHVPQLKKAAIVDVEVEAVDGGGHAFRVWVTNKGAGHAIPSDARHRSFDTYIKLWDSEGNVILDPLKPSDQARSHVGKYRKQYRTSGLKDTQIPPGKRMSFASDKYPGVLEVKEARKGRGEVWLVYRLTPRDALSRRSLELGEENAADLGEDGKRGFAVVVSRHPFHYGGRD